MAAPDLDRLRRFLARVADTGGREPDAVALEAKAVLRTVWRGTALVDARLWESRMAQAEAWSRMWAWAAGGLAILLCPVLGMALAYLLSRLGWAWAWPW
jgi:hypothetical protein